MISACKKDNTDTFEPCNNPNSGCLRATIGGENFEGLAVSGAFNTPFFVIGGSTTNSSLSLGIMPKPVGTYNYDENENVFTYTENTTSMNPKKYMGKSGTYTFSTVDNTQKILIGTFDLVMEHEDSIGISTINLTNGSFSVSYD